jgi:Protein of unknown function (DUF2628)
MIALLLRARDAKHVAVFTIHEPPNPPSDRIDRAEALMFVPDGFSFGAALFAPFWLASHRMWLALASYLVAAVLLAAGMTAAGIDAGWMCLAFAALHLWLGFEAAEIRRRSLLAQGWSDAGSVSGHDLAECERRFFDTWLNSQPILARHDAEAPPQSPSPQPGSPASVMPGQGLFARLMPGRA